MTEESAIRTIHAVPASEPVLVGTLRIHRAGRIKGRPVISCEAWCPWCRESHSLTWPDAPFPLEVAIPFEAPCRSGPFKGATIMVGLDPGRRAENKREILHHTQALRRWKSEERLRCRLAEAREADRRHLAEGWDVIPTVWLEETRVKDEAIARPKQGHPGITVFKR